MLPLYKRKRTLKLDDEGHEITVGFDVSETAAVLYVTGTGEMSDDEEIKTVVHLLETEEIDELIVMLTDAKTRLEDRGNGGLTFDKTHG